MCVHICSMLDGVLVKARGGGHELYDMASRSTIDSRNPEEWWVQVG